MKRLFVAAIIILAGVALANAEQAAGGNPKIVLDTTKGKIILELLPEKAPASVKNFLDYVDAKFYDGTIIHRVIPNFMIQGGGFTVDMQKKPNRAPIKNEADNGLKNKRSTIAMARTPDPHSATSQFFINSVDNDALNHTNKTSNWGYAVFGRVIEGIEVVDAISSVKTGSQGSYRNVPLKPVVIKSAKRLK